MHIFYWNQLSAISTEKSAFSYQRKHNKKRFPYIAKENSQISKTDVLFRFEHQFLLPTLTSVFSLGRVQVDTITNVQYFLRGTSGITFQEKATISKPLTAQDILISVESFCYFTTDKFTPMTSAFSPFDTNNNYWTSQSIIPGVRKSHLKLNFGAINVRTLCQIGSKAS